MLASHVRWGQCAVQNMYPSEFIGFVYKTVCLNKIRLIALELDCDFTI